MMMDVRSKVLVKSFASNLNVFQLFNSVSRSRSQRILGGLRSARLTNRLSRGKGQLHLSAKDRPDTHALQERIYGRAESKWMAFSKRDTDLLESLTEFLKQVGPCHGHLPFFLLRFTSASTP